MGVPMTVPTSAWDVPHSRKAHLGEREQNRAAPGLGPRSSSGLWSLGLWWEKRDSGSPSLTQLSAELSLRCHP